MLTVASNRSLVSVGVTVHQFVYSDHRYNLLPWGYSECECPKSFLARSDFGIGYLRNDAMHAYIW